MTSPIDRVVAEIERAREEIVQFTTDLVRLPTVNPPGAAYADCARLIGKRLGEHGFNVEYFTADGVAEHSTAYPRVNVVGARKGGAGPVVHINGHFDVVPAGAGWTVDPFGATVRDGKIYGRGVCDMKAGIAAAVYAAEAIRRSGATVRGTLEISGTVDEESGGFAGAAWLARVGRVAHARTDYVIIPEPLNVDRICIGHRGVYWAELTTRGKIGHGSMPFLGVSAIEGMARVLDCIRTELKPSLADRTTRMPVVPEGAAHATINVNGVDGGQAVGGIQTPCVADQCRAVIDRRFLIEEGFEPARHELVGLIERALQALPDVKYELRDLMVVHPTETPDGSPLVSALDGAILRVLDRPARLVASPGTYDQKHFARIAGVAHCVAYGPGELEQAHQIDEWCSIDDLVNATKVIALAALDLMNGPTHRR